MIDSTATFLVKNLAKLLLYYRRLLRNVEHQVKSLEKDLDLLEAFLKDHCTKKSYEEDTLGVLLHQIIDVCYDVENVLDSYVTQVRKNKSRNYVGRVIRGGKRLFNIAREVKWVVKEVNRICDRSRLVHIIGDKNDTAAEDEGQMEDYDHVRGYNELPYYLRPCFLYLGVFPEDSEIPVSKLICTWIAEGFIWEKNGKTFEQIAEEYLEDLIRLNLVMVKQVSANGKIKTCSIPRMLREFCINVAGRENFFQEWKPGVGIENFHRLCIHSNIGNFITEEHHGRGVRSFIYFSEEKINLQRGNMSFITRTSKFLRVLEAKPFNFKRFPSDLKQLTLIRYVCLSGSFKVLPAAISKLWNLQTLMVYTSSGTLDIRANIWKMEKLRHLKTDASAILPKPSKSTKECAELQTLGTILDKCCTEDVFNRIKNVKKLSIGGKLATLSDAKGLEKLEKLEKLKLVNEGSSLSLQEEHHFPPNLGSLTLSKTLLDWQNISTLGRLGSLKILKLKNNTFSGASWEVTGSVFQHLEVLHIECTDLDTWEASDDSYPKLRWLKLRECEKLQQIPSVCLGKSLQKLELKSVSESVKTSAKEIDEEKKNQHEEFELVLE